MMNLHDIYPYSACHESSLRPTGKTMWLAAALLAALLDGRAQTTPPDITRHPGDARATVGESLVLSAEVTGSEPITLQWLLGGSPLAGATSRTLLLTNLTLANSGNYSLAATNSAGSRISANATVDVSEAPARSVQNGAVYADGEQAVVPLHFLANGTEHTVAFSVGFATNAFANAVFASAVDGADVTLVTTNLANGQLGLTITRPAGQLFTATNHLLGTLRFDRLPGKGMLDGRFSFPTTPVAPSAQTISNTPLALATSVLPQFRRVDAVPVLTPQTGLFQQRLVLANATGSTFTNVNLLTFELGKDSLTNAVRLHNAVSFLRVDTDLDGDLDLDLGLDCLTAGQVPCEAGDEGCRCEIDTDFNNDGIVDSAPAVSVANLDPGETNLVTLEFYVSDLDSVPQPRFALQLTPLLPFSTSQVTTPVTVTIKRPLTDGFMIEFPTTRTNAYYIRYADTADELLTNSVSARIARPGVRGTGSRVQWTDYGPPKTDPFPASGTRFYTVLEGF